LTLVQFYRCVIDFKGVCVCGGTLGQMSSIDNKSPSAQVEILYASSI